jgi:hypothetical protein
MKKDCSTAPEIRAGFIAKPCIPQERISLNATEFCSGSTFGGSPSTYFWTSSSNGLPSRNARQMTREYRARSRCSRK